MRVTAIWPSGPSCQCVPPVCCGLRWLNGQQQDATVPGESSATLSRP
jgi:hypothetical protein